jgi:tRNA-specific 2-thiouridylase
MLQSAALLADDLSWTTGQPPSAGRYAAKSRYRQADSACDLTLQADGQLALRFPDAQWAVTPGQSAVVYDGDICLGGGVIASSEPVPAAQPA